MNHENLVLVVYVGYSNSADEPNCRACCPVAGYGKMPR